MHGPFYNRTHELATLERAWTTKQPKGQFLLLYGRRRLGKTYLLQHFFRTNAKPPQITEKPHAYFLADQTTALTQRLALAETLLAALPDDGIAATDLAVSWNALLRFVSQKCAGRSSETSSETTERFGLILDEFPYLVAQTPSCPASCKPGGIEKATSFRFFLCSAARNSL